MMYDNIHVSCLDGQPLRQDDTIMTMAGGPVESAADLRLPAKATKTWITVTTLLLGVIAYQLNASMVAPAVPEIARKLGTTPDQVGISQTLFFLVGGITGVVLARYSDH